MVAPKLAFYVTRSVDIAFCESANDIGRCDCYHGLPRRWFMVYYVMKVWLQRHGDIGTRMARMVVVRRYSTRYCLVTAALFYNISSADMLPCRLARIMVNHTRRTVTMSPVHETIAVTSSYWLRHCHGHTSAAFIVARHHNAGLPHWHHA